MPPSDSNQILEAVIALLEPAAVAATGLIEEKLGDVPEEYRAPTKDLATAGIALALAAIADGIRALQPDSVEVEVEDGAVVRIIVED